MVPDQPEREGRLHDQLLELESVRSAGLLSAAEHKSKREAVISRWEESQARLETTLAENKAKTQQLLHALRATMKHGSDLLSKKQMAGVRQAYLELTGLSSLPSAVPKLRDLCARCVAENFVPRRGRAGPRGAKRRAEDALDIDRETWGSWSLPDEPLDDLEDSGAPAPAPVTPDEVPPAPTEEEEPQEPEEKARRREWEAAKGIAAVAPVRREPLPQKRGRSGCKNGSSQYRGVTFCKHRGKWVAQVRTKGKQHNLCGYKDEEMAAKAYDKAVIKFRGKDADTNFPAEEYAEEMREMRASEVSVGEFICLLRSEAKRQNELERKAKEDKPKQAKTGYILFADHVRDRVKEDLTTDLAEGEKLHGRAIAKALMCAIAALWSKQDKETKEEWQARAKGLRAAVDQTRERAAVEVGPSTSRGGKAVEVDRPGPSKRPRHEGEGEATHAEYYARVADLYHSHKDAAGYENVQLKLES
uniref:AP2/ERF domain-containing protein n=1 Tax=Chloropicon roscoffensis TaxID=1461544 RepID=A0A7S3C9N0_9CHLO|mmetsp:Transcript_2392/g.7355  ORF Transcript_2392/g.7355 Transcript_2392/m.7355 type:complete len:474 (+) Transcript_2392:66-1487(+)